MNFNLDESQQELYNAVRAFAARLNEGMIERDARGEFSRDVWRQCAEFGIQGLPVPAEYGGGGRGTGMGPGTGSGTSSRRSGWPGP